ncbi:aldo/keto reductase [Pseudomonas sp. EA_35y_Pfl2_R111]|uniref:aldo/keto reductase n=1 Tax=Pseudomonas sp. EA_35y_Pfl2_R111 TaxID=3088689 RepID=UPI0030D9240F
MRLALGTVQFGMNYGVANRQGQVDLAQAHSIIETARHAGIDTLDTAIAYGESESTLGQIDLDGFKVITKLPALPDDCADIAGWVEEQLVGSLGRLRCGAVRGLLLHRPEQLLGPKGAELYRGLAEMKAQGLVEQIGVSIYEPLELDTLCAAMDFDLVQAPFNILDARLTDSGWLQRLSARGTELHVRSVFMQGLLLMTATERPHKFSRWSALWQEWHNWLDAGGVTPVQACLRHALSFNAISRVVVGVDTAVQLQEIASAANGPMPAIPQTLRSIDPDLLNPSRWNQL